jgi:hypothetical protein
MAYHKKIPPAQIITVKEIGNSYQASWDGEKKHSTAGPENAAKALVVKLLGLPVDQIVLTKLPDERPNYYRYQLIN